jgi:hypothetical protein
MHLKAEKFKDVMEKNKMTLKKKKDGREPSMIFRKNVCLEKFSLTESFGFNKLN